MKNIWFTILIFFCCSTVYAGSYYHYTLDEYDRDTGYYLKEVASLEGGGFLKGNDRKTIDIYIHFPAEEKGVYVFNGKNKEDRHRKRINKKGN